MAGHDVDRLVKIYVWVFVALLIGTAATVGAAYLDVSPWLGVLIGLLIASAKGSLVAAFFMHLVWEKKVILYTMLLTAFFFVVMMVLIMGHSANVPTYPY